MGRDKGFVKSSIAMKLSILTAVVIAIALTGCASNQSAEDKAKQCAQFSAIYDAYVLAREHGNPSESEVTAAQVAAIFLRLHCGYTTPPATRGGPPGNEDANRVPILVPPRS